MDENIDNTKSDISHEERIKLQKSYGIYYTDGYDYLQHLAPANDFSDSFCAYSHYVDFKDTFVAADVHSQPLSAIQEICSDSDLDDIAEDHYGDVKNSHIDLNMIVSEMVIDGLHNKKSTNSGKNKMGEPVEMSEYDKMFDDVLLSYDKPIDEDNFVKFNPASSLSSEADTGIDQQTKNSIIQLTYNMSSDGEEDFQKSPSLPNSPCPERADIQTPQQVYNPKLQYSNLFLPETISLRRKDSTTSSCVNIGSYVSSTAPSVASTFASNLFNRDKSESIYEKRERKHLVKKMKSERRQIKTSNRKAFTKEITRQKKIQSVTANRRTLNY